MLEIEAIDTGTSASENEKVPGFTVLKIGKFNTPHTPFDIQIDTDKLKMFILETTGLPAEHLQKTTLQFAAADVTSRDGLSHPISKIEEAVSFFRRTDQWLGITDHRMKDNHRTVTIFIGRLFQYWCHSMTEGINYIKDPNLQHALIRREKARDRFIQRLHDTSPEERERVLSAYSLYTLRVAAMNIASHEMSHVRQFGVSPIKDHILHMAVKYGVPLIAPLVGVNIVASVLPNSDLNLIFKMMGASAGFFAGLAANFGLQIRQEKFEKESYPLGIAVSSDPSRNKWIKMIKIIPDNRYFFTAFKDR